jgi:hypothetical protein
MNKYTYEVVLKVVVEAFDSDDAKSILDDNFGPGLLGDFVDIKSREYKQKSR